ncbi:MAG: hypothetical protein Kilf2KO_43720 [Rhodospirillales bacterium]
MTLAVAGATGSALWGSLAALLALLLVLGAIWLIALRVARGSQKHPPPPPRDEALERVVGQLRRHPFLAIGLGLGAGLLAGRSRGADSLLSSLALILRDYYGRRPPQ